MSDTSVNLKRSAKMDWRTMSADKSNSDVKVYKLPQHEIQRIFADVKPYKNPGNAYFNDFFRIPNCRKRKGESDA